MGRDDSTLIRNDIFKNSNKLRGSPSPSSRYDRKSVRKKRKRAVTLKKLGQEGKTASLRGDKLFVDGRPEGSNSSSNGYQLTKIPLKYY